MSLLPRHRLLERVVARLDLDRGHAAGPGTTENFIACFPSRYGV